MNSFLRSEFLRVAEIVLNNFSGRTSKSLGCYICLATEEPANIILVTELGNCSTEGAFQFCQEKALRVQKYDLISSWQNRDPANFQYGGAISAPADSQGLSVGRKMIISVSAFSEREDEAFSLVVGKALAWITMTDISRIASISENGVVYRLIEKCARRF